jgi:hypothetical protein
MEQTPQSQLKLLVAKGKEQGYLTYAEVNDHLPQDIVDSDQIEDIIQMINDMGIQVVENAPDADDLIMAEGGTADEDAAEAAAQALASVESEIGRTTDPVRMYMREMGTVELLTREGEIDIAKRIEDGINQVQSSVAEYPEAITYLLEQYDKYEAEQLRLSDIISGFIDPNEADDVAPTATHIGSRAQRGRPLTKTKTKMRTKTKTVTTPTMMATVVRIRKSLARSSANCVPSTSDSSLHSAEWSCPRRHPECHRPAGRCLPSIPPDAQAVRSPGQQHAGDDGAGPRAGTHHHEALR